MRIGMIKVTICVAALLVIGAAYADWDDLPVADQANIEDRRHFWNGHWGDRTIGPDVFKGGEVHGWVHPRVTNPIPQDLEVDPYPPGFDEQPPARRWYDSKNGLR